MFSFSLVSLFETMLFRVYSRQLVAAKFRYEVSEERKRKKINVERLNKRRAVRV